MITTKNEQEVETFLKEFKPKFNIWGIIFLHRDKNEEALRALGITPVAREEIIKKIEKEDYSHTVIDEVSYGDMWVFGRDYDGTELYIKISLGAPGSNTICISFHEAEHPLNYPFRK
ncbi:MAG: toxin [Muribaculaceae bacterium]|nr:toxin [Muribaculaceae bacterium]